MKPC
jgi:hypothetical protein